MEVWKIILLFKWDICRFQPLIFQGVHLGGWWWGWLISHKKQESGRLNSPGCVFNLHQVNQIVGNSTKMVEELKRAASWSMIC